MEGIKCDNLVLEKIIDRKEVILHKLKNQGCRITRQRKLIIDIILNNEFSCCKEIYWEAIRRDPSIGIATVYRMVNTLEDIGAINRKNMYKISYKNLEDSEGACTIIFKNKKTVHLPQDVWEKVVMVGLEEVSGIESKDIDHVILKK